MENNEIRTLSTPEMRQAWVEYRRRMLSIGREPGSVVAFANGWWAAIEFLQGKPKVNNRCIWGDNQNS